MYLKYHKYFIFISEGRANSKEKKNEILVRNDNFGIVKLRNSHSLLFNMLLKMFLLESRNTLLHKATGTL